jgi:hypothetical protein
MAVVINDFEVHVEPPAPPRAEAEQAPAAQHLRPEDIDRIVRHFERRRERLRAD